MNLRYVLTAAFLGMTACATPGPESTETVAMADDPASIDADEAELPVVTGGRSTDGLVCRMEKRAGSHMSRRVCRTPEEMQIEAIKAKETFDSLRKSQEGNR